MILYVRECVLERLRPKDNATCPTGKLGWSQAPNGIVYIVAWTQALSTYKTIQKCHLSQLCWFIVDSI